MNNDMPREVVYLASLLADPGWGIFRTRIESRIAMYQKLLRNPATERKDRLPDDYVRGRIDALEWALAYPGGVVDQVIENNEADVEDQREAERLDARTRLGPTFPLAI